MPPIRPQLLVSHANHSATETCMHECMNVYMYVCMNMRIVGLRSILRSVRCFFNISTRTQKQTYSHRKEATNVRLLNKTLSFSGGSRK